MSSTSLPIILFALCCSFVYAQDSAEDQCKAPGSQVTGFSVFTCRPEDANAFAQDFNSLIGNSRAEPGNLLYNMYTNPGEPGVIGFIEAYKDFQALETHLAQEYVTSIFSHQYYNELRLKPADLYGPWVEYIPEEDRCSASDERQPIEMVFYWVMNCTRQTVWDVITDWEDASWGMGHPETTMVPLDEDGQVMSDEEAANVPRPLDVQEGLGPVAQRRTWAGGSYVDVRMLSKNDSNFTTVQQTLSVTSFGGVTFDDYYVTMSLDAEGLDPDLQSRMRYHIKATVKIGTNEEARQGMKNEFYGPRIEYYQVYFNCTKGINMKRAERTITKLYDALRAPAEERPELLDGLFAGGFNVDGYIEDTLGKDVDPAAVADIKQPIELFATPDLRVVAVEDIVITSLAGISVKSRIVIYSIDEWGRIFVTRIFDERCDDRKCKKLVEATEKYYKKLEKKSLNKFERLFDDDAKVYCPVSFSPSISVEDLYNKMKEYNVEYTHLEQRSFVNMDYKQTAQLLEATYTLADGMKKEATPVEILSFDKHEKITMFESFYEPLNLDYAALEEEKE